MSRLLNLSAFVAIFLSVSCGDKGGNFSPTAPTGIVKSSEAIQIESKGLQNTCGNPNDWEADDSELQNCLSRGGVIHLENGTPGYIVNGLNGDHNHGLYLNRAGTQLEGPASIIAGRDLFAGILQTDGSVNDFRIVGVNFNGMVDQMANDGPYRRRRDDCDGNTNPGNIFLYGNNFQFKDSSSQQSLCGTGLGLLGRGYDVQNNYISYNGRDKFSGGRGAPWSDGMTVLGCEGGYIARNTLVDNTDISLALGGGHGCIVELNTVANFAKFAFSGINIGNFTGGDHSGSEYRGNTVFAGVANRLGMGISIGSHMWTTAVNVPNAGRVVSNTVYGANINLVVDGVFGGEIKDNTVYDPAVDSEEQGECRRSGLDYTVYPPHTQNTTLQNGWTVLRYDSDSCISDLSLRNRKW